MEANRTEKKKPVLVIMAAGMGSRYGGMKQIDPVDKAGHIIMDFSIYDARLAGFEKVIFVIKRENEQDFRQVIGDRVGRSMETAYVFQDLDNLPEGFSVPDGRVKPWGTGHAVLTCLPVVDGPFAVINADDYYGREAFSLAGGFLSSDACITDEKMHFMMVGYHLGNTLTENGHVSRGVCRVNSAGMLEDIVERTHIEQRAGSAAYTEDGGNVWHPLPMDTPVSMNMWGFSRDFFRELSRRFTGFLKDQMPADPKKSEYFLPFVVDELLREGRAEVKVLTTREKWFGVTYKEDKATVVENIRRLEEQGYYPEEWV